jgi:hypothetical protein
MDGAFVDMDGTIVDMDGTIVDMTGLILTYHVPRKSKEHDEDECTARSTYQVGDRQTCEPRRMLKQGAN